MNKEIKGTIVDVNDSKYPDVDIIVLWDNPLHGLDTTEVHPHEIEILDEQATGEQKEKVNEAYSKYKQKDKKREEEFEEKVEGDISTKKAAAIGAFKEYERVHLESDPTITGTYLGDVVAFDEAFEGTHLIEVEAAELESEGVEANPEQKAFANSKLKEYGNIQKAASKKKEDTSKGMPGEMIAHRQKELDDYEKVGDNYPKSKEIMPKGKFQGTLCYAEIRG